MTTDFRTRRSIRALPLLAAGLAFAALPLLGAEEEAPTLTDNTSQVLSEIAPLYQAKNWPAVLQKLDSALAAADPNSYDAALVLDYKAKALIQNGQTLAAIGPWERVVALGEAHPKFVKKDDLLQDILFLSNLYAEAGNESKDKAVQREDIAKAIGYIQRWLDQTPKKTEDAVYLYASLLLNQATSNGDEIDKVTLHKAGEIARQGLLMNVKPGERFYSLLIFVLFQENAYAEASHYLEYVVAVNPKKKENWNQLWAVYNVLAATTKDEYKARAFYARAVNTYFAAQKYGFLNTAKDKKQLVAIYYSANQFREERELLETGLRDGSIPPNDLSNWQLLAYAYQEINDYPKAIETYLAAEQYFPENGNLDHDIGQLHLQMDNNDAAFADFQRAIDKGHLDHGFETYRLFAFTAFQMAEDSGKMELFEKARQLGIEATAKYPEQAAREQSWKPFREAVNEAIKNKIALQKAIEQMRNAAK